MDADKRSWLDGACEGGDWDQWEFGREVYICTFNVSVLIGRFFSRAELDNLGGFLGGEQEAGGALLDLAGTGWWGL